jgi:hypothetical protein
MKKILLLLILVFIFSPLNSQAAEIFFGAGNKNININSKFEVGVFVDSQRESINAIEGKIKFPADSFDFQGFYTGGSVLSFWVTQPALTSDGEVSFSGIIPGGINIDKGYLFSLILIAKKNGNATINVAEEKILLNDGQGTSANIMKAPLALNISNSGSSATFVPLYDPNPPESFVPQITRDENIFDNKYFLAFTTQDKGSGIDHYEIVEKGQFEILLSIFYKKQWSVVESPYLLKNQSLEKFVYVKAVDKAGNEKIVRVWPKNYLLVYGKDLILILLVIMGLVFGFKKSWKKKNI